MKTATTIVIALLFSAALFAQERNGSATFDSAAQAYAFAASRPDTRLVMRVDEPTLHYVVITDEPAQGWRQLAAIPGVGGLFADQDNDIVLASNNAAITLPSVAPGNIWLVGHVDTDADYKVRGTRVVGPQQPSIADADGSVADLTAKLNAALRAMRAHGLIAE